MPSRAAGRPPEHFIRQCAWCWRVQDTAGRYRVLVEYKIREASHGICGVCSAAVLAEAERDG